MILKNISANQFFEPEGDKAINPQVSMIATKLLNDWLDQDKDILEIEYKTYMKKKENLENPRRNRYGSQGLWLDKDKMQKL